MTTDVVGRTRMLRHLAIAFLITCGVGVSLGQIKPTVMEREDAARLDAAMMHLQQIQQQCAVATKPYVSTVEEIGKTYGFDPAELGRTVVVDMESGEIKRVKATPKK